MKFDARAELAMIREDNHKPDATPRSLAIPAIPAIPPPLNSQNSRNSHAPAPDAEIHEAWAERAAIRQFDGGMAREAAEAAAWADIHGEHRDEPPPPAAPARPDHGHPPADLIDRLAAALAADRPWQRSTGPEAADYWRSRALAMLDRLDPLARGLLVQAEEAAARPWRIQHEAPYPEPEPPRARAILVAT